MADPNKKHITFDPKADELGHHNAYSKHSNPHSKDKKYSHGHKHGHSSKSDKDNYGPNPRESTFDLSKG